MTEEPIEPKFNLFMKDLARGVDDALNGPPGPLRERESGFFMFFFDFKTGPEKGRMNYISNADRLDVLQALKEMVAQLEEKQKARMN